MKIRNYILAIAVVAVAGVNVYSANATKKQANDMQLSNIEMLAEGANCEFIRDVYHKYGCFGSGGTCTFSYSGGVFTCDGVHTRIW